MGISGGPDTIENGLVLSADAADTNSYPGSGTSWLDMSGNNNTGNLTNSPTFDSGSIKSMFLNGTSNVINFGAGSSLSISNNVSLDIWFKLIGNNYGLVVGSWAGIIAKRDAGAGTTTFGVNHNGAGNTFQVYFNTGGVFKVLSVSTSQYFSPNTWTNLTVTYTQSGSNTVTSMYKNGSFATSSLFTGNIPSSPSINLLVGASYGTSELTNMNCGSVKVYNRVLSASEVLQNYNALKSRFNL